MALAQALSAVSVIELPFFWFVRGKVGGDAHSTINSESSFMHVADPAAASFDRGWEFFLAVEAKKRNPDIRVGALAWGWPYWTTGSVDLKTSYLVDFAKVVPRWYRPPPTRAAGLRARHRSTNAVIDTHAPANTITAAARAALNVPESMYNIACLADSDDVHNRSCSTGKQGLRSAHNITLDFMGLQNEGPITGGEELFAVTLRTKLTAAGFGATIIDCCTFLALCIK